VCNQILKFRCLISDPSKCQYYRITKFPVTYAHAQLLPPTRNNSNRLRTESRYHITIFINSVGTFRCTAPPKRIFFCKPLLAAPFTVHNIPLNGAAQKVSRTWPHGFFLFSHNLEVNHKQLVGRKLNVLSSGEINWNLRYLIHYIELTSNRSKIFVIKPNCKTLCPSYPYNYSPKPILILFISFQYSFRGTTRNARQIKRGRYSCFQQVYHPVVPTNPLNENVALFYWSYCWHSCFTSFPSNVGIQVDRALICIRSIVEIRSKRRSCHLVPALWTLWELNDEVSGSGD
jgi:hypothetical protein